MPTNKLKKQIGHLVTIYYVKPREDKYSYINKEIVI